jgi:hypothetical protein
MSSRVGIFSKCLLFQSMGSEKVAASFVRFESISRIVYIKNTDTIEVDYKSCDGYAYVRDINSDAYVYDMNTSSLDFSDRQLLYAELMLKIAKN